MRVLVINCGSSSLKYKLINMATKEPESSGLIERIGQSGSVFKFNQKGFYGSIQHDITNHEEALNLVINILTASDTGVIYDLDQIDAIGHRVVHGGEFFKSSVIVDDQVKNRIRECFELAPLHNPANLLGIETCESIMPGKMQVAIFDTAFHQTLEPKSFLYAIPKQYYEKYQIRRYGFHGTSHKYLSQRIAKLLDKDLTSFNTITCHLGNGSSIAAIKKGKSIDTSMGFTPLAGLPMGTRCGDIDPAVATYIMKKEQITPEQVEKILNGKSGMLGLSGLSSDFRDLTIAVQKQNHNDSAIALDLFAHNVKKYIGAYMAILGQTDVIIFSGGIGENDYNIREKVLLGLENLGIKLDKQKNSEIRSSETEISTPDSKIKVWVVPTNEELMIAQETLELIEQN